MARMVIIVLMRRDDGMVIVCKERPRRMEDG